MAETLLYHTPLFYLVQSLWRDEAFSVLLSQNNLLDIIRLTSEDYNPPLYYLLLHAWMLIVGSSEIAVRLLSFVFHAGLVLVVYKLAKEVFGKMGSWFPLICSLFVAINPMLVYFAFEARMYSLFALLSALSTYFLLKRSWKAYVLISTLSLYTHVYSIFLLMVQGMWVLLNRKEKEVKPFTISIVSIVLLFFPWAYIFLSKLMQGSDTWFYAVDGNLIKAVLGNLYLGYEGTPHFFWKWSKLTSVFVLVSTGLAFVGRRHRKEKELLALWLFFPLILVIGMSFVKTIYVTRYMIFTVPAEIILVIFGIYAVSNKTVQGVLLSVILLLTIYFNYWYAPFHAKVDFRSTFTEINRQTDGNTIIATESALPFFESSYYAFDQEAVFLYNPERNRLPDFVGPVLIPESKWIDEFPKDKTTYFIHKDGSYETITYEDKKKQ